MRKTRVVRGYIKRTMIYGLIRAVNLITGVRKTHLTHLFSVRKSRLLSLTPHENKYENN